MSDIICDSGSQKWTRETSNRYYSLTIDDDSEIDGGKSWFSVKMNFWVYSKIADEVVISIFVPSTTDCEKNACLVDAWATLNCKLPEEYQGDTELYLFLIGVQENLKILESEKNVLREIPCGIYVEDFDALRALSEVEEAVIN
jgi:hypothetical protein